MAINLTTYACIHRIHSRADLRCLGGKTGAPHTDEACSGTTMKDYLRVTDLSHIPDDLVALYDDGTVEHAYEPTQTG